MACKLLRLVYFQFQVTYVKKLGLNTEVQTQSKVLEKVNFVP